MVIVSVFLYSVLPWSSTGLRVVFKLLLLPVVMGISYEPVSYTHLLRWRPASERMESVIWCWTAGPVFPATIWLRSSSTLMRRASR